MTVPRGFVDQFPSLIEQAHRVIAAEPKAIVDIGVQAVVATGLDGCAFWENDALVVRIVIHDAPTTDIQSFVRVGVCQFDPVTNRIAVGFHLVDHNLVTGRNCILSLSRHSESGNGDSCRQCSSEGTTRHGLPIPKFS